MITIQGTVPRDIIVATSGGVDSMAVVDFLKNNHNVTMAFFNHDTQTSKEAQQFLQMYSMKHGVKMIIGNVGASRKSDESLEEYWRNQRYIFFHRLEKPIITCHHLDDCVETWVWSSLHGEGKVIPYNNRNVIRPFRLNKKEEFVNWANKNKVEWIEDTSNTDTKFMRNHIRHTMMPDILKVNPGIQKVIRKKIKDES